MPEKRNVTAICQHCGKVGHKQKRSVDCDMNPINISTQKIHKKLLFHLMSERPLLNCLISLVSRMLHFIRIHLITIIMKVIQTAAIQTNLIVQALAINQISLIV
jgi:hypothetical protein